MWRLINFYCRGFYALKIVNIRFVLIAHFGSSLIQRKYVNWVQWPFDSIWNEWNFFVRFLLLDVDHSSFAKIANEIQNHWTSLFSQYFQFNFPFIFDGSNPFTVCEIWKSKFHSMAASPYRIEWKLPTRKLSSSTYIAHEFYTSI